MLIYIYRNDTSRKRGSAVPTPVPPTPSHRSYATAAASETTRNPNSSNPSSPSSSSSPLRSRRPRRPPLPPLLPAPYATARLAIRGSEDMPAVTVVVAVDDDAPSLRGLPSPDQSSRAGEEKYGAGWEEEEKYVRPPPLDDLFSPRRSSCVGSG